MNTDILKGIRILDFTRVLAGPYATRLLADFGAEVIKVQSKKTATGAEFDKGGYFNTWNRNKKSITLDLTVPKARDIALNLVNISHVVIENFTPRVMTNFGMNYEKLKTVKPDIIMLSMSGLGSTGPWKNHVAFGPTVQALGGLTYMTAFNENSPQGLGNSYADPMVGLYGALAVLAALEYKDKTGKGQHIDLSGYESVCTAMGPTFIDLFANQKNPTPQGNGLDDTPAAPYGCYRCKGEDRWCVIAVFHENQWEILCKLMGHPDRAKEEQFSTLAKRKAHLKEIDTLIGNWTSRHTPEHITALLQDNGIPSAVVQDARDLANDPQLNARKFFAHLDHPELGETISDISPIKMGPRTQQNWRHAPLLGADNRYVYLELLGFSEEELASYVEEGIIG